MGTDDEDRSKAPPSRGRRWWAFGLALFLALGAIFAVVRARRGAHAGDELVLHVASQKGSTKAMLAASGALEGVPYRIEWSEFPAAQHLLEALGAGAVDCGLVGDAPFQFAYQGGSPLIAIQGVRYRVNTSVIGIIVPGASHAQSGRDLKGLRIATGRGSVGHYVLLRALEEAGLSPNDVQIIFLSPADANAAFSSGAIDAWSTWTPYLAAAVLHGGARVLVDGRALSTGTGFMAANVRSAETKRALLEDFLERNARALAWASSNTEAYAAVLSKETGLPIDVARYTANRGQLEAVAIDDGVRSEQRDVLDHFTKAGALRADRDLVKGFDATFFRADAHSAELKSRASIHTP